jgi:hypothetical protein
MFLFLHYIFFFKQNWRTRGWNRFCRKWGGRVVVVDVAKIMYTHVSKCENDKRKK